MSTIDVALDPHNKPFPLSGRWRGGLLLFLFGLTLSLYFHTLNQPFFWDDVPNLDFASSRSLGQIWTDETGLPYYRPLTVTLNKALFAAMPTGSYFGAHLLLIVLHAVNGWLVGIATAYLLNFGGMTRRHLRQYFGLQFSQWGELLAGLLFVTYPFAALPIAQFGSLVHPLVTFFIVVGVVSIFAYVSSRQICWLFVALISSFLAPYVHESGVMAGPTTSLGFLLAQAATTRHPWQRVIRRNAFILALFPLASALFLPVWFLVPKSRGEFVWTNWEEILASLTFFSQSFSFPLQRLSRLLVDLPAAGSVPFWTRTIAGVPIRDVGSVWLVSGMALGLLSVGWRRTGRGRILVFGLVWTFLAALPNILWLPFSYITVSQRLLYLTGAPAVILWAVMLLDWGYPGPGWSAAQMLYRVASAGLVSIVMLTLGSWYIDREIRLHTLALEPLSHTIEIAQDRPGQQILIVNPPLWINYRRAAYVMGHEGVSVSAPYIDFDHLIDINSAQAATTTAVTFPDIKAELGDYYYATVNEETPWATTTFSEQLGRYDSVWITEYAADGIQVVPAGWVRPSQSADSGHQPDSYLARFDDRLLLADMQTAFEEDTLQVSLDWVVLEPMPDVTIFRHITNCAGEMISQGDGMAVGRILPFDQVASGTEIRDIRTFSFPADAVDDCIRVYVGFFHPDGSRVPAVTPTNQKLADNAFFSVLHLSESDKLSRMDVK